MSSEPLFAQNEDNAEGVKEPLHHRAAKIGAMACGGVCFIIFVLVWLLQGFMYAYATTFQGCRASSLAGFDYDGDAGLGNNENVSYNLMPRTSLLIERSPHLTGEAFYLVPSNEAGTMNGGQVGTWWRTWGPIFETYTYEDMSSKTTIYMRRNLLRIGSSHRIARCDGTGPEVTFTEGSNYFGNVIRSWFRYNQAKSFKVYNGNDEVGIAEEAAGDVPSLTFRNMNNDVMATSVLADRNFHNKGKQEWLIKIADKTQQVPYYVQNAATLLFAFYNLGIEHKKSNTASLAAMPKPSGTQMKQQQWQKQQQKKEGTSEQTITVSAPTAIRDKSQLNSTAIASGSTPKAPVMIEQHI